MITINNISELQKHIKSVSNKSMVNEPYGFPSVRKGFVSMPAAGARNAPEEIVLELFRESFFTKRSVTKNTVQIDPEDNLQNYTDEEKAIFYATRGRKKLNFRNKNDIFYMPAYPCLARNAWFREKAARVVRGFFYRPISQYFHGSGKQGDNLLENQLYFLDKYYRALIGHRTPTNGVTNNCELLSLVLKDIVIDDELYLGDYKKFCDHMIDEHFSYATYIFSSQKYGDDPLAKTIYEDTLSLCRLESEMPRMQWLEIWKSYLRIAPIAWFLTHSKITILLRNWILDALDNGNIANENAIINALKTRHENLLHASTTYNDEIVQHVANYMKARIELNVLLYAINLVNDRDLEKKVLVTTDNRSGCITISKLLILADKSRNNINCNFTSWRQFLTRCCEHYKAWKDPINKGDGSNFEEFTRLCRKLDVGDEDGSYILTPKGKTRDRSIFIVFPGHMMLKLFAYLSSTHIDKKNKMLLADVEEHFAKYGIDFYANEGARPKLIESLAHIGLLKGSPDAGNSIEVKPPYHVN